MQNTLRFTLRSIALVLSLALTLDQLAFAAELPDAPLPAQYVPTPNPQPYPPAMPAQILNAHKVFLANAGAGNGFQAVRMIPTRSSTTTCATGGTSS